MSAVNSAVCVNQRSMRVVCLPWGWAAARQPAKMVVVEAQKRGAEGTVSKEISTESIKGDTIPHVWASVNSSGSVFEQEPGIVYK